MASFFRCLAVCLIISLAVVIHELGHFVAASSLGCAVSEFSIGFGPRVFSVRVGEVDLTMRAILLGGYNGVVENEAHFHMLQEADLVPRPGLGNPARWYENLSAWKQLLILIAGPLMNLIAGLLCIALFFGSWERYVEFVSFFWRKSKRKQATFMGPIEIYRVTAEALSSGWKGACYAFITLSLGMAVFNILPIPPLDGGRIGFAFYKVIVGVELGTKAKLFVNLFGLWVMVSILLSKLELFWKSKAAHAKRMRELKSNLRKLERGEWPL